MREQWAADLEAVTDYGMSPHRYAVGLLLAAARLRALPSRRPRIVAIGASLALLITGGSIAYISTSRPVCRTPQQVLGVLAGDTFYANGLADRVIAAMRAIRRNSGFEGVWVERDRNVYVGVYGPSWAGAQTDATAVAELPGPRITYVCEPATGRQLLATQRALSQSPLWDRRLIGSSGIDVKDATVTVSLRDTAPTATEADLTRKYGDRLKIERSQDPFVEMSPGRGRVPLAQDSPQ